MHNPLTFVDDIDKVGDFVYLNCNFHNASVFQTFPNVLLTDKEDDLNEEDVGTDSDSSSDDWENSLSSSDLNYSTSESENDDDEVLLQLPKLSKYFVTF